jgi:uncharacterized protein YlxW (UPF0749 family)
VTLQMVFGSRGDWVLSDNRTFVRDKSFDKRPEEETRQKIADLSEEIKSLQKSVANLRPDIRRIVQEELNQSLRGKRGENYRRCRLISSMNFR